MLQLEVARLEPPYLIIIDNVGRCGVYVHGVDAFDGVVRAGDDGGKPVVAGRWVGMAVALQAVHEDLLASNEVERDTDVERHVEGAVVEGKVEAGMFWRRRARM